MIAVDTSTLIAYLGSEEGADVALLDQALAGEQLCLPPVVLAEVMSSRKLSAGLARLLCEIPLLEAVEDYWRRAGELRRELLRRRRRAPLADTLIAQSCIDHDVPLISRDIDFRPYATYAGLRLLA